MRVKPHLSRLRRQGHVVVRVTFVVKSNPDYIANPLERLLHSRGFYLNRKSFWILSDFFHKDGVAFGIILNASHEIPHKHNAASVGFI